MSPRTPVDHQPVRPFVERHIGPDEDQVAKMLGELGLESLEQLMDDAVPGEDLRIRLADGAVVARVAAPGRDG